MQVLAGKDRGKQGRVLEARPSERRVIVENLNLVKRHTQAAPDPRLLPHGWRADHAGRHRREAVAARRSRTSCSCARPASRPTRVGVKVKELKGETVRVRFCKRCNEEIDR